MARRKDHTKDELEALIVESATSIVIEGGIDALTARNVALRTGYVAGTIYNVFPSMDILLLRINARTLDEMHRFLSEVDLPHKDIKKNMMSLARAYRLFIKDHKALWLLLFSPRLPGNRHQLEWYQERIDRLFDLIEALLKKATLDQKSRKLSLAARTLWASFHGLCFLEESGHLDTIGNASKFEDMSACLIDSFVGSLRKPTLS